MDTQNNEELYQSSRRARRSYLTNSAPTSTGIVSHFLTILVAEEAPRGIRTSALQYVGTLQAGQRQVLLRSASGKRLKVSAS